MTHAPHEIIGELAARIAVVDESRRVAAKRHLDQMTKPPGSLGDLEEIASRMFALKDGVLELSMAKAVYVFAADHGVAAEGVSAYPAEVTRQMVLNFLEGGAAINVLARANGVPVRVVDVGVDGDLPMQDMLLDEKVRRGSRNMLHESAMSDAELALALGAGLRAAEAARREGVALLAIGEMGIGNTTAATAITALLCGVDVSQATGRGTGVSDERYRHKQVVIAAILARHSKDAELNQTKPEAPLTILQSVGGLELAAMAGMVLAAASHRIAVVIDGFIATAAAALACALVPATRGYLFAGHRSQEPGHRILLQHLCLDPILDLNMRLGEGTGAVLAMPIIQAAVCIYLEMATFASAGISGAHS